jgi:hypothetical protein
MQVLVELGHHFARLQAAAVGPQSLQQAGGHLEQRDVMLDHRLDAGAQDLYGYFAAVRQFGEMHLRHRGRGHRAALEAGEDLVHRLAIGLFQLRDRLFGREGRHPILQSRQLVGDIQRQQVAASGKHLAELDEDRAQVFQRLAQADRTRRRDVAPEQQALHYAQQARAESLLQLVVEDQAVEAVAIGDTGNAKQAEDAHGMETPKMRMVDKPGPAPVMPDAAAASGQV